MSHWENASSSPHTEVHAVACEMAAEVLVSSPHEADPASHRGHGMGGGGHLRWLHGLPDGGGDSAEMGGLTLRCGRHGVAATPGHVLGIEISHD